jgi:DNA-binding PucR family transcriptional regulator
LQKSMGALPQVTVIEDLGIYQLLSDAADPRAVEEFIRRWLGRLLDHDAEHDLQLVPTLGTYLDCGGSYERSAESLFIHRNTLKYRLRRIREVSGLELGAPEVNFNLQLATRALRALQALRGVTEDGVLAGLSVRPEGTIR